MASKPKPRTAHEYIRDLQRMALLIPESEGIPKEVATAAQKHVIEAAKILMSGMVETP